jgi:hypothetical protein
LEGEQDTGRLRDLRDSIENGLHGLARLLEQGPEGQVESQQGASEVQIQSEMPACVAKAIDNFRELQMACDGIVRSAADPSPAQ